MKARMKSGRKDRGRKAEDGGRNCRRQGISPLGRTGPPNVIA